MRAPQEIAELPYADALRPFDGVLTERGDYDTVHFSGGDYTEARAPGARFIECAFTSVNLDHGSYRRAAFNEVWMHTVRMAATDLGETRWLDSTVASSLLAGVVGFGSELRRVVFTSCKLNAVNFRAAVLHDVVFQDCVLVDVDFGEGELNDVTFPGSRLENIHLSKASLHKVDFRGASSIEFASGHESLRGATVDTAQLVRLAPALAETMGITVREPGEGRG